MTEITTEEEANRIVEETEKNLNRGFCPLINNICVPSCVCYSKTRWHEYKGTYIIYNGCCNNAMFFNE